MYFYVECIKLHKNNDLYRFEVSQIVINIMGCIEMHFLPAAAVQSHLYVQIHTCHSTSGTSERVKYARYSACIQNVFGHYSAQPDSEDYELYGNLSDYFKVKSLFCCVSNLFILHVFYNFE